MIELIDERLTALVDRDDDSDWDDVQRLARRLAGRKGWARRSALVAAAVILLTIVVAPALAIERGLLPWFQGEPAPPDVTEKLTSLSRNVLERRSSGHAPPWAGLRASETRGVMALETPVGSLRLWAVPSQTGEACTITELAGRARGLFCPRTSASSPISLGWANVSGYGLLEGRAHSDVTWLGVRFANDSAEELPLVDGYFLSAIDLARDPVAVTFRRDVHGHEIEESLELPPVDAPLASPPPTGKGSHP